MRDDALPIGRLLAVGVTIAVVVASVTGVVAAMLSQRGVPAGGVRVARPAPLGAELPMLQSAPQPDLARYRADKQQALQGLGWVDAASGVAHVPIEVAMALRAASAASGAAR